MPTYEYYCEQNDQIIEVLHGMEETLTTWGELCACAGIKQGDTPESSTVERKLSAVSLLPKKGEGGSSEGSLGGCCGGGGCGCRGH
jgi:predicted nucleic acid-binding Zn ribbon protein